MPKSKIFLYLKKFWKLFEGFLLQVLKLGSASLADQKVCLGSTRQKGGSVASLPILQCKLKNYSIFSNGATDLALLQICLYAAELLENWLYKITWWDEDPRVTFFAQLSWALSRVVLRLNLFFLSQNRAQLSCQVWWSAKRRPYFKTKSWVSKASKSYWSGLIHSTNSKNSFTISETCQSLRQL